MPVSVMKSWAGAAAEAAAQVQEERKAEEDAPPGRCALRSDSHSDTAADPGRRRRPRRAPLGSGPPASGIDPTGEQSQSRRCSRRAAPRGDRGSVQRSTKPGLSQPHHPRRRKAGGVRHCSLFHRQRLQEGCPCPPGRPSGLCNPRRAWRWWWSGQRYGQKHFTKLFIVPGWQKSILVSDLGHCKDTFT